MDQGNKLSPMEMVAREMSEHSSLDVGQLEDALQGVMRHLRSRAEDSLQSDPNSEHAVRCCREYQAVAEVVLLFGSQLIAFEDIEAEDALSQN